MFMNPYSKTLLGNNWAEGRWVKTFPWPPRGATAPPDLRDWRLRRERPHRGATNHPDPPEKRLR
eukprot:6891747-Alexandrium_andersonii.AAC.1